MKNEIELLEHAAFIGPFVGPDDPPNVKELEPSEAEFPCPRNDGQCKTADWLKSRARAGLVFLHLDTIIPDKRTSDQENDLGIALAWAADWKGAAEAFAAAKKKAKSDAERRKRAADNADVAERAKS